MINLKSVFYSYNGATSALDNINVSIQDGEAVALIGPNGSGKSTFMKLINGIILPKSGSYFFNEDEITKKQLDDNKFSKLFHKKIGFVFQNSDAQLFCSNVYDEIAFGPRQMGMKEDEIEERVFDLLSLLNIESLRDREPYNLSGGEKKKVAIASVLSLNPEVLVLDEPLNDIDPKSKRFMSSLLRRLNKSGKTIICSTHEFEYMDDIFTRCLVFSEKHQIIRDDSYIKVIQDLDFLTENNIK